MITEASGPVDSSDRWPLAVPIPSPCDGGLAAESDGMELPPKLLADLLDFDAWGEILTTYGRTMRVAVALTDVQGHVLGRCHNAQPVWKLVHDAVRSWGAGCPFCITTHLPCTAVAEALQAGGPVMVRDQAGLIHVAVPLSLGKVHLGAIIAGQVFDRYPEPLPLRRLAKEFGVSARQLWDVARKQRPVSSAILQTSGDLLCALGQAFLQQRYGAILKSRLAETNGRFRLLVEGVRDYALFTMDPTGCVTSWNIGAERMLGYVEAEIVGQNFSCIYTPEDIQNQLPEKHLHKALHAGRVEDEGWRVRGNRRQFWAHVNITTLLEGGGPVRGFAIIMQDVSERRKIAIVLEEARQERARLQESFLSHVSHELRTPLTAIYFFTTNVLDGLLGDLTPEQREHLSSALDNVKQLKDMVSDLLDITRVETHKITVEPQQASPVKLVADAFSTCRTNATVKNISLRSEVAPGLPFVWADPARVRQILINLIDNGIKFTPESGTITVGSRVLTEDGGFLCLSVSDTGCGISPEYRDIVFDRLAQVKSGAGASRSGLGLGLFISKELVSRHGGRIWVESQLGHGSTFYFTLPVFSLAKLCAHVFTAPNLEAGSVTLIAVDVAAVEGAVQEDILQELRRVLERCINPDEDVLLPSMNDAESAETFFIVACTGFSGFEVIASRIAQELRTFDHDSKLKPVISSTTLLVEPGQSREAQIGEVTARIERLVQAHLLGKERTSNERK
jgi:PAS domain S-box-containing protein